MYQIIQTEELYNIINKNDLDIIRLYSYRQNILYISRNGLSYGLTNEGNFRFYHIGENFYIYQQDREAIAIIKQKFDLMFQRPKIWSLYDDLIFIGKLKSNG